jgi:aspartate kinase
MTERRFTVIKVGGSILRSEESYRTVARLLAERLKREPTWIVVSAAQGITDALERLGRTTVGRQAHSLLEVQSRLTGVPCTSNWEADLRDRVCEAQIGHTDRLLAWGEQASTAALRSHLFRFGIRVPIVELTQGIRLPSWWAALVPGFYVRDRAGKARCLPRGGSDISALLVAAQLGARSVRLWKDGGGILSTPNGVMPEIEAAALLPSITRTIRPLHPAALLLAIRRGIDLVLEDPFNHCAPTRIMARGAGSVYEGILPFRPSPVARESVGPSYLASARGPA